MTIPADDRTRVVSEGGDRTRRAARPLPVVVLEIVDGEQAGRQEPIHRFPFQIGRQEGNDLVLRDPSISGRHARIRNSSGQIWLDDLGSRNGVWFKRHRIERVRLQDGDVVRLGAVRLEFRNRCETGRGATIALGRGQNQSARLIVLALAISTASAWLWSAPDPRGLAMPSRAQFERLPPLESGIAPIPRQSDPAGLPSEREPADLHQDPPTHRRASSMRQLSAVTTQQTEPSDLHLAANLRSPNLENWKAAAENLRDCGDCRSADVRDATIVLTKVDDLPAAIARWSAAVRLVQIGHLSADALEHVRPATVELVHSNLEALVRTGQWTEAAGLINRLDEFGLPLPMESSVRETMRERARAEYHRGYALREVNPGQAEKHFERALRFLPRSDPLRERIQASHRP